MIQHLNNLENHLKDTIFALASKGYSLVNLIEHINPAIAALVVELPRNVYGISGVECRVMYEDESGYFFMTYALDKNKKFTKSLELGGDATVCKTIPDLIKEIDYVKMVISN